RKEPASIGMRERDQVATRGTQTGHHRNGIDERQHESQPRSSRRCTADGKCTAGRQCPARKQSALSSTSKLVAITPRRKLRAKRSTHSNERRSITPFREPDIIGGHSNRGATIRALSLLECLPSVLHRREVPSLASAAHHPE